MNEIQAVELTGIADEINCEHSAFVSSLALLLQNGDSGVVCVGVYDGRVFFCVCGLWLGSIASP